MTNLAPVAIFAYKRPRHLARALDALERCPEFSRSEVLVFIDGPKCDEDRSLVEDTCRLAETRRTPNMTISVQARNRGLAESIITEVTILCETHGRVIVIEDDLLVHPMTLAWLNQGLDAYANDRRVMQISAYQYRVPEFETRSNGTFQRFTTTWGWATWKRAWDTFDPSAAGWEAVGISGPERTAFDAGGVYPFSDMLVAQMGGRLDSWGIRWSWSVYKSGGLTLMPPRTLVRNDGFGEAATHNSIGVLKKFVQGRPPRPWSGETSPLLPGEVTLVAQDQAAFRRGLLRTHAQRNARVKAALYRLGMKRFA